MIEKNPQKTFDQIVLDMFDLYNMQIKIILKDIPEIMKKPWKFSYKLLVMLYYLLDCSYMFDI